MRVKAALILGISLFGPAAQADWQYVKWGMTISQLVTASNGDLSPTAGDGGKRIMCIFSDQKELAWAPDRKIGPYTFDVIVCGNGGAATSVSLRGKSGNYNPLRTELLAKYGKPIQDEPGDMAITTWRDEKGKNLVRLRRVLDGGSIEYRSLSGNL